MHTPEGVDGAMMAGPKAQQLKSAPAGQEPPARDPLRVLLVGRTGLDGRLRLDPAIELVRARTPLDAVGELSLARRQDGSTPTVALVSAAADPDPAPATTPDSPARREFLAALRRLDANIRVLWVDAQGAAAPDGYDGEVRADAGVEEIREVMTGKARRETAQAPKRTQPEPRATAAPDQPRSRAESAPAPTPPVPATESQDLSALLETLPPAKAGGVETGDEVLVRLLLQGADIADAAMELIRRRLGGRDVTLAAHAAEGPSDQHEAPIAWRGRVLGHLRSRDMNPEDLAIHAAWLAPWLVLRDQHAQLREAAFSDALTGAHNRRYFDQFLRMAMEDARKERRGITLLMFDIDDFKQFNDRHGHAAGDEILRETVRLLRSVIRPSDRVCRIGGDEFVVVFHEPTGPRSPSSRPPSDVCQIAERFQREISEHRFPKLGREAPGRLTISGGLATYPWDGATPEALLARADDLAMQSKRRGKNCIVFGPGAEGPGDTDSLSVIGRD